VYDYANGLGFFVRLGGLLVPFGRIDTLCFSIRSSFFHVQIFLRSFVWLALIRIAVLVQGTAPVSFKETL